MDMLKIFLGYNNFYANIGLGLFNNIYVFIRGCLISAKGYSESEFTFI